MLSFTLRRHWSLLFLAAIAAAVIACGSAPGSPARIEGRNPTPTSSAIDSNGGGSEASPTADSSANFSLLSTNGGVVNFNDLRGTVPVAVFFYGGADCTGCEVRLRTLQSNYGRFKALGAEVVAISTNQPEHTRTTVDSLDIEFPVLSDSDGEVSDRWGVFNLLGNGHAAPALFVFGPSGEEIARQTAASATALPGVDETLQVIQRSLESGNAAPTATSSPQQSQGPANDGAGVFLHPRVTDFRLPDAINGGEVTLSETLRDRNVVLVFYRAFW